MPRRKPFSAAKKKKQLKEKRQRKRKAQEHPSSDFISNLERDNKSKDSRSARPTNAGTERFLQLVSNSPDAQSLRTLFRRDSDHQIAQWKDWAQSPLGSRDTFKPRVLRRFKSVDFPVRPPWHESFEKHKIEQKEDSYFLNFVKDLYAKYGERLNHFEHSIQVWRQLWRVLEMSDMYLLVADIRHPLFHFPSSLYEYITEHLQKPVILLLNKCDLVTKHVQNKWIAYFKQHFPKVHICLFTSFNEEESIEQFMQKKNKRRVRKKPDYSLVSKLWEKIQEVNPLTDLPEDTFNNLIQSSVDNAQGKLQGDSEHLKREDKVHVSDHHITIGLIGHPNVGKSCVLNALVGKHVVSASYTPGHTKHFQTFFVDRHVKVCDSPGLVFPAIDMPKQLQVLCGMFPIAQVREPFSVVHYLCQRVPVEKVLRLEFPKEAFADGKHPKSDWSGWLVCRAFAEKHNFTTKRGRCDEFKAANKILRDVLYGNILLYFEPPEDADYEHPQEEHEQMTSESRDAIPSNHK